MLLHTLRHELAHTFYMMLHGMTPSRFEIEFDRSGEYFGDCTPGGGQAAREAIIVTAYVGPLGEIRSQTNGLQLQEPASIGNLVGLLDSPRQVEVYFVGEDQPRRFPKEWFGGDWIVAHRQANDAAAENAGLDIIEALTGCMSDAIRFVNDDVWWNRICVVADELAARADLQQLGRGHTIDIRDDALALVRREIAGVEGRGKNVVQPESPVTNGDETNPSK